MEDGLSSGLIGVGDLEAGALFRRHWPGSFEKGQHYGRVKVRTLLRRVIADLVIALVEESERRIREAGIEDSEESGREAPASASLLVELPARHDAELRELKTILHERLYRHPRVAGTTEAETRRLPDLFRHYLERPEDLPTHFQQRIGRSSRQRVVCDYIAGMTDRFATWDHQRRFGGSGAR